MIENTKCPWCGNKMNIHHHHQESNWGYFLSCDNDRCLVKPEQRVHYDTQEKALNAWELQHDDTIREALRELVDASEIFTADDMVQDGVRIMTRLKDAIATAEEVLHG